MLKRAKAYPTMPEYLMKPYRFLTAPALKKGRVYTAVALQQQGVPHEVVHQRTGVPYHTLRSYQRWCREGSLRPNLQEFIGRSLKVRELVEAHGAWAALYAQKA